jgi:hypothetical protein
MNEQFDNTDAEENPPPKFLEAMDGLKREQVFVPAELDERILKQAHEHLRKWVPNSRGASAARQWLAMATAVTFTGFVVWAVFSPSPKMVINLPADVDRNGRVDIVDAFELARWVEAGDPKRLDFDLNHDGSIDQRDVDAVAGVAVQLNEGGV